MNKEKSLTIQMAIFFLLVTTILTIIVISEKKNIIFLPIVENKINTYIEENYNNLNLKKSKLTHRNNTFSMKLTNEENKEHYFYITYSNKKISDTYETDYKDGQSIINSLTKKIKNNIFVKTNEIYKVTISTKYNNFSNVIKEKLKETDPESLKIYTLEIEITTTWDNISIQNKILEIINNLERNEINPKQFTFIITNKDNITQTIKINNLTKNDDLNNIINDIINNNNTSILEQNNITYEYLN